MIARRALPRARASLAPRRARGRCATASMSFCDDDLLGMKSWELAEGEMLRRAAQQTADKAQLPLEQIQLFITGDLNNQIIASGFAARALAVPFLGQYGACSTFIQSLVLGCALVSGGMADNALCAASSHFCTAERQFRFPLEMGNQRPPQASWTATACGLRTGYARHDGRRALCDPRHRRARGRSWHQGRQPHGRGHGAGGI